MKYNSFNCWNWSLKSGFICWRFTKKMDLKEWNLQKDWQSWLLCYIAWHNDEAANGWQCWQKWSCLVISVKRAETRKMESAAESAISSCGKIVFFLKKCPYLLIFCSVLIVLLFLVKKLSRISPEKLNKWRTIQLFTLWKVSLNSPLCKMKMEVMLPEGISLNYRGSFF